ncbi:MAG: OmpA family protein [Candidatus Kapaibacterium sp.]
MSCISAHIYRCLIILLLVGLPTTVIAQDADKRPLPPRKLEKVTFRAGVYGAFAYNIHKTEANVFLGGADCGAFGDGDGKGFTLGAFAEIPVLEKMLDLYASVGYAARGGTLGETVVGGLPILDPITEEYTTLERRHSYTASLNYLRTEFGVRFTFPWFPLYIRGTAAIDFPQGTTFEQKEEILSPQGVVYPETNIAERTVAAGDLQNPESLLSASGAIGYDIPLSTRLSVAPEVSYYHPFNDVVLNRPWTITSIQGGAALRWSFGPLEKLPDPPRPPALEPVEPPSFTLPTPPVANLRVSSPKQLSVVKTIVTETFPILPYVFFDSGSNQIPGRYKQLRTNQIEGFDEEAISWRSLEAYHDLLNIIGQRMRSESGINITLNGTTDGREVGTAAELTALAKGRAESIKEYLTKTWNIDPKRITVTTSSRPQFPSSEEYGEGYEENRRVEITSNSPEAIKPIIHKQFNEYSYQPDKFEMEMSAEAPSGITSWNLQVNSGTNEVIKQGGEGPVPPIFRTTITQEIADKIAAGISGPGELQATLTVRERNGEKATEEVGIPTNVELNPFEVSRLSLIVFDFDKSEITQGNREMVKSFVSDALNDGSTMTIVGSTDRLGELEHNKELSQARAETVKNIIAANAPEATITTVEGVGPKLRYDNSLPEGRYYCRTVTVEVKTPIGGE